ASRRKYYPVAGARGELASPGPFRQVANASALRRTSALRDDRRRILADGILADRGLADRKLADRGLANGGHRRGRLLARHVGGGGSAQHRQGCNRSEDHLDHVNPLLSRRATLDCPLVAPPHVKAASTA